MKLLVAFLLFLTAQAVIGDTLKGYGADSNAISVSGISAGACFATQFHVSFSAEIMGAGIIAGTPFYCAKATLAEAEICMYSPYLENINYLIDTTKSTAATGFVDPVSNMEGDKVYIFAGTRDTVVFPGNGPNVQQYYEAFGADIETEFDIAAEHCQPTVNYGNACSRLGAPYINDCDYSGAYNALNFIYGNLVEPPETMTLNGQLILFDQSEFISGTPDSISMDSSGYIYVPSGCTNTTGCKLHLAFHGCKQGRDTIDDEYVRNAGYNEVGELNNIIIVYPQIVKSLAAPSNPNGCFDWWGYTSVDYASNIGPQMKVVHSIMQRVLSSP